MRNNYVKWLGAFLVGTTVFFSDYSFLENRVEVDKGMYSVDCVEMKNDSLLIDGEWVHKKDLSSKTRVPLD